MHDYMPMLYVLTHDLVNLSRPNVSIEEAWGGLTPDSTPHVLGGGGLDLFLEQKGIFRVIVEN